MTDDLSLLIDRLRFLVDHPGDELGAIEHTLTDGYASALALEAERRRAEAQVRELARGSRSSDLAASSAILKVAACEQIDGPSWRELRSGLLGSPRCDRSKTIASQRRAGSAVL